MHITKTMGIQLGLMITAFVIAVVAPPALAEDEPAGQTVEQKAQKRRGTGEDENIKSRSLENKADEQAPAPPSKGGDDAKTRGARGCFVVVDNWTPWKIQIFMDGDYVGLVSAWGEASGWYSSGRHNLYGVASFYDAPDSTWGPQRISCSGSYTWKLVQ